MNTAPDAQNSREYLASYAEIAIESVTNNIDTNPDTTTHGAIADPEGRLAPTEVAPWKEGCDVLDEIFSCLYDELDNLPSAFPCRHHVDATGRELSMISSEAAVHLFDIDTIYKPAKNILDHALGQPALRSAISDLLRRRGHDVKAVDTGKIVFSPHGQTITIPDHTVHGQKRKRATSSVSSETGEQVAGDVEMREEIQVVQHTSSPVPSPASSQVVRGQPERVTKVKVKASPGNYYCSFIPSPAGGDPVRIMVGEAKAPHKLTRRLIQNALRDNTTITTNQFMQHVDHNHDHDAESPAPDAIFARTNTQGSYSPHDQRWLAAVATQIYSTLQSEEVRYGYITTSQTYILLQIQPGHATTLEYMLVPALRSQPPRHGPDARVEDAWRRWLAATPLARLTCLALLFLFTNGQLTRAEVEQAEASKSTMIWRDPRHREQLLESRSFVSSVATKGTDPDWTEAEDAGSRHRSGHNSLKRRYSVTDADPGAHYEPKRSKLSTLPTTMKLHQLSPDEATTCKHRPEQGRLPQCLMPPADPQQPVDALPFCTSACIASIVNHTAGDPSCPNLAAHMQQGQRPSASSLRTLARSSVTLPLTRRQCNTDDKPRIIHTPTTNAKYTGQYGAISAIFKVRIEPGGYVLAAKAARVYEQDAQLDTICALQRENKVYQKLRTVQGEAVPVCLGFVDLSSSAKEPHIHQSCQRFPAYLLLSWAGSPLLGHRIDTTDADVKAWVVGLRSGLEAQLTRIHELGVLHQDAELRNLVLPGQPRGGPPGVMIVDFERAVTRGGFCRRVERFANTRTFMDDEMDQGFSRVCLQEREHCLAQLDSWAGGP